MKVPPTSLLERIATAHAIALLAGSLLSIVSGRPEPLSWLGLACFVVWLVLAHISRLAPAPFCAANLVTTLRIALTGYLGLMGTTQSGLHTTALIFVIFTLDGLDGYIARKTNTTSEFGAAYDMESDAFLVMTLSVLLWTQDIAGPWVLLAGLLRYLYALAVRLVPTRREAPRSRLGRYVFAIVLTGFAIAFALPAPLSTLVVAVATLVVTGSFLHSAYWSFLSKPSLPQSAS